MSAVTELRIVRARHHLRLPDAGRRAAATAFVDCLAGELASALECAGIGEVVCVRRLSSTVTVPAAVLAEPLPAARRWADGLAAVLLRSVAACAAGSAAGGPDVLVYRDADAVAMAAVRGTVARDLSARWAWVLAGIVRPDDPNDPPALAAAVLARRPRLIPAVLPVLAGSAPDVLRAWPVATWELLGTRLVLRAGDRVWLAAPATSGAADGGRSIGASGPAGGGGSADTAGSPDRAGSAAREPGPATWDAPDAAPVLAARLRRSPAYPVLLALLRRSLEQDGGRLGAAPSRIAALAALLVGACAPELAGDPVARSAAGADLQAPTVPDAPGAAVADASPEPAAREPAGLEPVVRTTGAGGLLYLLHLVVRRELPVRLADPDHPLAGRPLCDVLGALGRRLSGCGPDDAAVLAFHGRLDAEPAPVPFAETERDAVDELAAELRGALAAALPDRAAATPPDELLASVVRRPAVISGEPGWIEITFAAELADVDIRRVGLDLDPGYLPFLGCVVRFRYV